MRYLYYPGCSLKGTGRAYEESALATFEILGIDVEELHDWNCCGATAYMSVDETNAFALAARNLALAEAQANTDSSEIIHLIAPCSACYLVLAKAQRYMQEYPDLGSKIEGGLSEIGLTYSERVRLRHPLDIFVNDIGLEGVSNRLKNPLNGLKVACYYGCQIVRPFAEFDDQANPTSMDDLITAIGGEPVDWPLKTRCCGGSMTGTIPKAGLKLSYILLQEAKKRGADVIATACPLCQFNLECYQGEMARRFGKSISLPVAYFTQLMGLAMGLSKRTLGIHRSFVPLMPVIRSKGGVRHANV